MTPHHPYCAHLLEDYDLKVHGKFSVWTCIFKMLREYDKWREAKRMFDNSLPGKTKRRKNEYN